MSRRVVVVGAGAWGLPAAAELARRGHDVVAVDAFGPGNAWSSSSGATRIWRLAHPDAADIRLARDAVAAWRSLEERTGRALLLTRGLLWRDARAGQLADVLATEGVDHTLVEPVDVGRFFPGLPPDDVPAVWQPEAGPVLAAEALAAQAGVLADAGGRLVTGRWVLGVEPRPDGVRVVLGDRPAGRDGATTGALDADVAVLAAGPWAQPLLDALGVGVRVLPGLGQVAHVTGRGDWAELPCLLDGYQGQGAGSTDTGGIYALPTPGLGYKLGRGDAVRPFDPADADRTPDDAERATLLGYAARLGLTERAVDGDQVCAWTDSPDGGFVLDRVGDGRVVVATGDTGHGFKFSAVMGLWVADLVEGRDVGPDVARFGLARFRSPGADA